MRDFVLRCMFSAKRSAVILFYLLAVMPSSQLYSFGWARDNVNRFVTYLESLRTPYVQPPLGQVAISPGCPFGAVMQPQPQRLPPRVSLGENYEVVPLGDIPHASHSCWFASIIRLGASNSGLFSGICATCPVLGEVVEELARGTFDRAAVDRFVRDWGRFVIDHATNDDTRIMGQQMLERQDVEVPQLFYHLITRIPEYCGVASPDGDTLSTVDWDKPVLFVYGTGLYDVDYLALAQRGYMLVATLHYMRYEKGGREYGHWIVCVRNQNGEWELRNDMRSTSIIPNPFAAPGTVTAVIMARQ